MALLNPMLALHLKNNSFVLQDSGYSQEAKKSGHCRSGAVAFVTGARYSNTGSFVWLVWGTGYGSKGCEHARPVLWHWATAQPFSNMQLFSKQHLAEQKFPLKSSLCLGMQVRGTSVPRRRKGNRERLVLLPQAPAHSHAILVTGKQREPALFWNHVLSFGCVLDSRREHYKPGVPKCCLERW